MISGMPVTFMEIGTTSSLTRWEDIPHLFRSPFVRVCSICQVNLALPRAIRRLR